MFHNWFVFHDLQSKAEPMKQKKRMKILLFISVDNSLFVSKKIYVRYLRLNLWHPTVPNRYRICYNNETKKWGPEWRRLIQKWH